MVDQICLDVPASTYDAECDFWSKVLGLAWRQTETPQEEFRWIPRIGALRVLLQRLEEPDGPARAHLDLGCDDRQAEVRRHVALGAEIAEEYEEWTQLRDPAGSAYCITDHHPG
ncbi:VOC family protein [Nocardioides campestrisoli]|uniref:VOC family protein n=1 Tax=Nocardioides campestrisoli TaxID=2736757 RepID=UPI001CD3A531|nr:VOC family protein [Nocardioides campestrisoli]